MGTLVNTGCVARSFGQPPAFWSALLTPDGQVRLQSILLSSRYRRFPPSQMHRDRLSCYKSFIVPPVNVRGSWIVNWEGDIVTCSALSQTGLFGSWKYKVSVASNTRVGLLHPHNQITGFKIICGLVTVFRDVALCCLVEIYDFSNDRPDDGGSKHLWNVCQFVQDCKAQQPRRQPSSYSTPWEPEVSPSLDSVPTAATY
jgi:hypothetical protein